MAGFADTRRAINERAARDRRWGLRAETAVVFLGEWLEWAAVSLAAAAARKCPASGMWRWRPPIAVCGHMQRSAGVVGAAPASK